MKTKNDTLWLVIDDWGDHYVLFKGKKPTKKELKLLISKWDHIPIEEVEVADILGFTVRKIKLEKR